MSATPNRADGLSKVFQWHLGDIVFKINKREEENVRVKLIEYEPPSNSSSAPALDESDLEEQAAADDGVVDGYNKIILNYNKKPNMAQMINNICSFFLNRRLCRNCKMLGRNTYLMIGANTISN